MRAAVRRLVSDVADLFDDWARRGRAEGMERGHGVTAGALIASLPIKAGTRFLDLGCGNGWAARYAASRGAHSLGIDASGEMVRRATAAAQEDGLDTRFEAPPPAASFYEGDFAHIPSPNDAFHLGWSMEALYYAPDPDAVLREVHRVMAPSGAFHMIIDHYAENEASHSWPTDVGVPMRLRSEAEWVQAFTDAGFTAVTASRLRTEDAAAEAWKREHGSLHVHGTA